MALTYRYVALTDTGRRRSDNQDSGYASPRLLALADGMGGAGCAGSSGSVWSSDVTVYFLSSRMVLPMRTWAPRPIVVGCVMRWLPR